MTDHDPTLDPLQPGPDETLDRLSNTLQILQRRRGHRATSDDVLLAGFAVKERPHATRMLDLGTGKATVAMLVARTLPEVQIVGVEAFAQSHALALRNVALNGLGDRIDPRLGDLRDPSVLDGEAPFDLICGAPPFMPLGSGVLPSDPQRAAGRFEIRGGVEGYAETAFRHLAPGGTIVLLMDGHGRDRLVAALGSGLRRLTAVLPRAGKAPTYWIGIASDTPAACVEDAFVMRDGDAWSATYGALRRALDLD